MKRMICSIAAALCVSACGGGGGGSVSSGGGTGGGSSVSPGGIWNGTLNIASTNISLTGLIDETGRGAFFDSNGNIYRGSGSMSGAIYNGNYKVFLGSGGLQTATVTATVVERSALQNVQTHNSSGQIGTGSATYNTLYNLTPSFATIQGTYHYTVNGVAVTATISSSGHLGTTDSAGCTGSGQFTIIDPMFNGYSLAATISCPGVANVSVTGLASYQPASGGSVATLTAEYDNGSNVAVFVSAPKG